jgi:hypothetical protein
MASPQKQTGDISPTIYRRETREQSLSPRNGRLTSAVI